MASKNVRNSEFKLGKQSLVLFILGMSLLLFCVFLFGVVVGKRIDAYPEIVSRGIPDMIWKKLGFGKEKAQTEVAMGEETDDSGRDEQAEFDLTFYDTLTRKGKGNANAARHVKAGTEMAKAPATLPGVAPGIVRGGIPGKAPGKAPGNGPGNGIDKKLPAGVAGYANSSEMGRQADEEGRKKSSLPVDAGQGRSTAGTAGKGYVIHVASFREKGSSDQLAKKLAALGYAARVQMRDLPGKGRWFRVVVSDFKTREQAQKVLDSLDTKIRGLKATILAVDEKKD